MSSHEGISIGNMHNETTVNIIYRQISNTSRTKPQTLNVSHLVLQLSLSNPLKPGIK